MQAVYNVTHDSDEFVKEFMIAHEKVNIHILCPRTSCTVLAQYAVILEYSNLRQLCYPLRNVLNLLLSSHGHHGEFSNHPEIYQVYPSNYKCLSLRYR